MASPRFKVATCEGYLSYGPGHTADQIGVSASVLDTFYAHRCVKTFRSEDWTSRKRWQSRYATVVEAQRYAEALNAAE